MTMAPASLTLMICQASVVDWKPSKTREPPVVGMSLVDIRSLATIGMPSSGRVSPALRAASAALACAMTSGASVIIEFRPNGPRS